MTPRPTVAIRVSPVVYAELRRQSRRKPWDRKLRRIIRTALIRPR